MHRLILMRHGKSSWKDPELADFDRPLKKRGRKAALRIGGWLKEKGHIPERALVSPALRARETWDGIARAIGAVPAEFVPELYHAEPEAILSALRGAGDAKALLILGHQPGIGALARQMLREPPEDAVFAKYPTAAVAVIEVETDGWRAVAPGNGRLADFVVPRALE